MIVLQRRPRAIGSFWNPEPGERAEWSDLTAQLDNAAESVARQVLVELGAPSACLTTSQEFNAACMAPARAIAVRRIAFNGAFTGPNAAEVASLAREVVASHAMPTTGAVTDFERSLYAPGGEFAPTMVGYELAPGIVVNVPIGEDGQAAPGPTGYAIGQAWQDCEREYNLALAWSMAKPAGASASPATVAALMELRDANGWQQGSSGLSIGGQPLPHWRAAIDSLFAPCFDDVRASAEQYAATGVAVVPGDFEPKPIEPTTSTTGADVLDDVVIEPEEVLDPPTIYTPDTPAPVHPPARSTVSPVVIVGGLLLLLLLVFGGRRGA